MYIARISHSRSAYRPKKCETLSLNLNDLNFIKNGEQERIACAWLKISEKLKRLNDVEKDVEFKANGKKFDLQINDEVDVTACDEVDVTVREEVNMTTCDEVDVTGREKVNMTACDEVEVTGREEVKMTACDEVDVTGREEVYCVYRQNFTLSKCISPEKM